MVTLLEAVNSGSVDNAAITKVKLYIATETNTFVESPTFPRLLLSANLKRRDTPLVDVVFLADGEPSAVPTGTTARLGIKPRNNYSSAFWVSANSWTAVDATTNRFTLSLNTVELNAAFAAASEPASLEAMLEIQLTNASVVQSTNTLPLIIDNDVVRGDEGEATVANTGAGQPCDFIVAASSETSLLTTGTNKVSFRSPYAFTLTNVRASLSDTPTQAVFIDVNKNGVTVLGNLSNQKLRIDANEKTSVTAITQPTITVSSFASDDEISIDVDQGVAGAMGKGLKVTLLGIRT